MNDLQYIVEDKAFFQNDYEDLTYYFGMHSPYSNCLKYSTCDIGNCLSIPSRWLLFVCELGSIHGRLAIKSLKSLERVTGLLLLLLPSIIP
jgi:hypothetical protein